MRSPERGRLVDVVGHEHDRLVHLGLKREQLLSCRRPRVLTRVDRPERLVHQEDRRVAAERPGHPHPLALAPQRGNRRGSRFKADQLQQSEHPGADPVAVPAEQPWHHRDVVARPGGAGTGPPAG